MQKFKQFDNCVDTILIMGAEPEKIQELLKNIDGKKGKERLDELSKFQCYPQPLSMFPEQNRGFLDINQGNFLEMNLHSFGQKFTCLTN